MIDKDDSSSFRRTVLVVEDEPVNSQLLGFILSDEYNVLYAENGQQALDILNANIGRISMVLTDIKMPVMDGFTLIRSIRENADLGMIPIMVLTSETSFEETSLQLGAIDFLSKPYKMPTIIRARVRRIIELSEGRMIIKATERDLLTGLYTKEFFFEYAQRLAGASAEPGLDAVVLDVDRFHIINELYGHNSGDRVLKGIADSISAYLEKRTGICSRYEKDVFFILCEHSDDHSGLVDVVEAGMKESGVAARVGVRVGVFPCVSGEAELHSQFEKARNACNSLKKSKAETVAVYNDALYEKELLGERLMNEMQKAIEEQQFKVWFQPKFNIRGDKPVLCSAEALVRWKHPELGMVSPGVFIPLFEQNGLIQDLDLYVWRTAACQIAHWKELFGLSIPVSVNVSRIELFDPSLKDKIVGILEENGLGFDDIALEITESAYSSDSSQLVQAVRVLQNAGFRIEIDDFGTGYSSLNRLAEMPVDVIKLDMSFVRIIHENSTMLSIVQLIIQMAKSLGAPVIAEGVELEQQYQLLKEMGCEIVQGYYFSKPLPSEDFETFIKDNR